MANVQLEFQASAGEADPHSRPLLVLGQLQNLHRLHWSQLQGKLQPRVTEEVKPPPPSPGEEEEGGGLGKQLGRKEELRGFCFGSAPVAARLRRVDPALHRGPDLAFFPRAWAGASAPSASPPRATD